MDPQKDVDVVILSHVPWDQVSTPSDFLNMRFAVGAGTLRLLANEGGPLYPKELFNFDDLPLEDTFELPPVGEASKTAAEKRTQHR